VRGIQTCLVANRGSAGEYRGRQIKRGRCLRRDRVLRTAARACDAFLPRSRYARMPVKAGTQKNCTAIRRISCPRGKKADAGRRLARGRKNFKAPRFGDPRSGGQPRMGPLVGPRGPKRRRRSTAPAACARRRGRDRCGRHRCSDTCDGIRQETDSAFVCATLLQAQGTRAPMMARRRCRGPRCSARPRPSCISR